MTNPIRNVQDIKFSFLNFQRRIKWNLKLLEIKKLIHLPIDNLLFHRVLSTKWMNGQEQIALDINITAPALQILPAEVKGRCV